jgi:hypothetical protein
MFRPVFTQVRRCGRFADQNLDGIRNNGGHRRTTLDIFAPPTVLISDGEAEHTPTDPWRIGREVFRCRFQTGSPHQRTVSSNNPMLVLVLPMSIARTIVPSPFDCQRVCALRLTEYGAYQLNQYAWSHAGTIRPPCRGCASPPPGPDSTADSRTGRLPGQQKEYRSIMAATVSRRSDWPFLSRNFRTEP